LGAFRVRATADWVKSSQAEVASASFRKLTPSWWYSIDVACLHTGAGLVAFRHGHDGVTPNWQSQLGKTTISRAAIFSGVRRIDD
jgi:hypothetical protein